MIDQSLCARAFNRFTAKTLRLPWLAMIIAAAVALPVVSALASAFVKDGHLSLDHFGAVSTDSARLLVLFAHTAGTATVAVTVALGVGVPLSFLIFRTNLPWRRLWTLVLLATCCLPPYVTVTSWLTLFELHTWTPRILPAGWVLGLTYLPLVSLISGVAFLSVDPMLERLTLLDGSPWQVVRSVSFRQAASGILAAGLVVAVLTASDITVTDVLAVRTFTEEVFVEFQLNRTPGPAVAVAVPMLIVVVVVGVVILRMFRSMGGLEEQVEVNDPLIYRLGHWRPPLLLLVLGAMLAVAVPFISLMRTVGSVERFAQTLRNVATELTYSAALGILATFLAAMLAWTPARAIVRSPHLRAPLSAWLVLLMVVPAPLVGIGLAELMNRPGWSGRVYDSPFIVALAFLVRFLPYQTVATVLSLRAVPVILEEDAFVCGATRLQVTRYVVAPLCVGGAVVGALIVLILSLGEVGASVLVAPPGRTTLTIHFFTLIHYGVYADAAAICLILAGLVVALSALVVISIDGIGSLRKASRRLY